MKKTSILLTLCCLMVLSACQKKNAQLFRGDYSFKTSGNVTAKRVNTSDSAEFNITLNNEIGQLQIASLNKKHDSLVVVMNYMNGDVVVTHACCQGQNISLKEFKHNSLKVSFDGNIDMLCEVNVNANGTMYDENTLILNMTYNGVASVENLKYNLYGDDIKMVATRN